MSDHGRRVIMPHMTRYPGREHTRADKCQKLCDLIICSSCLYSVKADFQHIMNIVKTTLFLIVYRFSVLLFYPRKIAFCPDPEMWGGGGGILLRPNLKLFSILDGFPRFRMNQNQSIV